MKKSKFISILLCITIPILLSIIDQNIEKFYISELSNCVDIFLILLGFAITSYTFVYDALSKIITSLMKNGLTTDVVSEAAMKLTMSIKENMIIISVCIVGMIACHSFEQLDFPYLVDTMIYSLPSLKIAILNYIYYLSICFAVYAYIDIVRGIFKIAENSFKMLNNVEKILSEGTEND